MTYAWGIPNRPSLPLAIRTSAPHPARQPPSEERISTGLKLLSGKRSFYDKL